MHLWSAGKDRNVKTQMGKTIIVLVLSSLSLVFNNIGKVGGGWGFGVAISVVWKKIHEFH